MNKMFPYDFLASEKGERKERLKNHVCFGGQFKYSVGVVLNIYGRGIIIWWAF